MQRLACHRATMATHYPHIRSAVGIKPKSTNVNVAPVQKRARRTSASPILATAATDSVKIDESVAPLFTPFQLGPFKLDHRMVYPPLTRMRASIDNVPQPLMAEYYAQRATKGGLVISEASYTDPRGIGYPAAAGIYSKQHSDAWKPVVQAVKDKGAVFFCQLIHCGRAAHPEMIGGQEPVAPSAIAPSGEHAAVYLGNGQMGTLPTPRALERAEVKEAVEKFRQAARHAIDAGFDGIELHGANGYLLDQFTKSGSNKRTDEYGGSIENRCRFALEVTKAVVAEVGAERVGYRISPFNDFLDCVDETPVETFGYLVEKLAELDLAYLHGIEGRFDLSDGDVSAQTLGPFRKTWKKALIVSGNYKRESGAQAVASGYADLVAYGRLWIANPDLPKRFQLGAALNRYDRDTFYSPGPKGYTDYPFLDE